MDRARGGSAGPETFRATISHWLVVALTVSPLLFLGAGCVYEGSIADGLLLLFLSLIVIGYNATARLVASPESVSFRRYGWTLWSVPTQGTRLSRGLGGDVPILRGYYLTPEVGKSRFLLKGLFPEAAIEALRRKLGEGPESDRD